MVFAPNAVGAELAAEQARACANLAIGARGDEAPANLHYLPTDANVLGISDMGLSPDEGGKSFPQIVEAVRAGEIRALLIHDDNPLLNAPGSDDIAAALDAVDVLVVVDSLRSSTAERADVVLGELPFFAREGTITSAESPAGPAATGRRAPARRARGDRDPRRARRRAGRALPLRWRRRGDGGESWSVWQDTCPTGRSLPAAAGRWAPGQRRCTVACRQSVQAVSNAVGPSSSNGGTAGDGLTVLTGRSLYTSWDGASIGSEEADQLHREESALINPRDAEAAGVRMGDEILLTDGTHELRTKARLDDGVAPGAVYIPHYYDGGAVMSLFPLEGAAAAVASVRVRALQTA